MGDPCRPGYREAGWRGKERMHLLKTEKTLVGCGPGARRGKGWQRGDGSMSGQTSRKGQRTIQ